MKKNNLNVVVLIFGIIILILLIGSIIYYTQQVKEQQILNKNLSSEINFKDIELTNQNIVLANYIKTNIDLNNTIIKKDNFEKQYMLAIAYLNLADYQLNSAINASYNADYYDLLSDSIYEMYNDSIYDVDFHKTQLEESLNYSNKCITNTMKSQNLIDNININDYSEFWKKEINLRITQRDVLFKICSAQKKLANSDLSRIYYLYELNDETLLTLEIETYNGTLVPNYNLALENYLHNQRTINLYWENDIYDVD
jgi:hypothetical protein